LRVQGNGREMELILFESARKRKRDEREMDVVLFAKNERRKRDVCDTV
jgi:hypothetical protein